MKKMRYQSGGNYKLPDLNAVQRSDNLYIAPNIFKQQAFNTNNKEKLEQEQLALSEKIARSKASQKADFEKRKNQIASNIKNSDGSASNSAVEDKMRLFPDDPDSIFDTYLNPLTMIGGMADKLAHTTANKNATLTDYAFALGTPLAAGAFAGAGAKTIGQFANNLTNPFAGLGTKKQTIVEPQEDGFRHAMASDLDEGVPEVVGERIYYNLNSGAEPSFMRNLKAGLGTLDSYLGEKLLGSKLNPEVLQKDLNAILKEGLGIKKNKDLDLAVDVHAGPNDLYSIKTKAPTLSSYQAGEIIIRPQQDLKISEAIKNPFSPFYNKKGFEKIADYPFGDDYDLPRNRFNPDDIRGAGAEFGEALKRAIKKQNRFDNLYSSEHHTEEGAKRYLGDYLNNRRKVVSTKNEYRWLEKADELKESLKGRKISSSEIDKLLDEKKLSLPSSSRFLYGSPALYAASNNQNNSD